MIHKCSPIYLDKSHIAAPKGLAPGNEKGCQSRPELSQPNVSHPVNNEGILFVLSARQVEASPTSSVSNSGRLNHFSVLSSLNLKSRDQASDPPYIFYIFGPRRSPHLSSSFTVRKKTTTSGVVFQIVFCIPTSASQLDHYSAAASCCVVVQ